MFPNRIILLTKDLHGHRLTEAVRVSWLCAAIHIPELLLGLDEGSAEATDFLGFLSGPPHTLISLQLSLEGTPSINSARMPVSASTSREPDLRHKWRPHTICLNI